MASGVFAGLVTGALYGLRAAPGLRWALGWRLAGLLSLPGLEEGESLLRLVYAEALSATGNEPAAEDALDVARRRVLGRAARILDPGWRASFCENVPENARTLALARAVAAPAPGG